MYYFKPQEKPQRWGTFQDVQYAIRANSEKIYGCDPDNDVLVMPLFWGLPPLDFSGKNNHGTNIGATWKGGSLDFDGSDDYIDCGGDGGSLDVTNVTVSAWVRIPDVDTKTYNPICGKGDTQWMLRYSDNVEVNQFHFFTYDGNWYSADSDTNPTNNVLYYVVGTCDGSNVKIYVNGKSDATPVAGGITSNAYDVEIGRNSEAITRLFNGAIDEVRISNVARTADQIALFYERPWDLYRPVSRPVYFFQAGGAEHTKNLSDTINMTDARIASFGLNKADSMSLSDSISKGFGLSKADSIALSDGITKAFGLNKGDTINLSDAISSKTFGLNKADTVSLSDNIAKKSSFSKADTISLSDSIVKKPGLNKADSISLSDNISSKAFGLNKADTITLSDSIAKSFSFSKADTINMSDSISTLLTLLKSLSDTINMSDAISSKTFGLNKSDIISLSDSVAKGFGLNKADTIAMTDEAIKAVGLSLSDNITLSDSLDSAVLGVIAALFNFIAKNKTFNFIAKNRG